MPKYHEKHNRNYRLKKEYDDIVSKHSGDIGLTHLEEMKIETDPN